MTLFRVASGCLIAGLLGLSGSAIARDNEKPFVALDYSQHAYQNSNKGADEANPASVRVRVGTLLNRSLALETHAAFEIANDDILIQTTGGSTTYRAAVTEVFGIFAKPQIRLTSGLSLYGLAGYAHSNIQFTLVPGATTLKSSEGALAYGGGAQLDIGKHWGMSADFVHYAEGLNSLSGGVLYRF